MYCSLLLSQVALSIQPSFACNAAASVFVCRNATANAKRLSSHVTSAILVAIISCDVRVPCDSRPTRERSNV